MKFKTKISLALASVAFLGAMPASASIGHGFFMRGSIVADEPQGKVVCIGSEDGAAVGQVLDVFRTVVNPGPSGKGAGPSYRRVPAGHVRIDHIYNGHFAHVSVVYGSPSVNDIVELHRTRR